MANLARFIAPTASTGNVPTDRLAAARDLASVSIKSQQEFSVDKIKAQIDKTANIVNDLITPAMEQALANAPKIDSHNVLEP